MGRRSSSLLKKVPDVVASALLTVRMKVGQFWIIAIAVERFLRGLLDKDHHRAWLDVTRCRLAKLAKRNNASAVRLHLLGRTAWVGKVLVTVCDIKEVECIYGSGHRNLQTDGPDDAQASRGAFAELSVPPVCQNCASKKVGADRHSPLTPISKPSEFKSENFHWSPTYRPNAPTGSAPVQQHAEGDYACQTADVVWPWNCFPLAENTWWRLGPIRTRAESNDKSNTVGWTHTQVGGKGWARSKRLRDAALTANAA